MRNVLFGISITLIVVYISFFTKIQLTEAIVETGWPSGKSNICPLYGYLYYGIIG